MTEEASPHDNAALRLVEVRKQYGDQHVGVKALDGVTLSLAPGTFTAVMGPSGSGKSTLLQCAAGLDQPSDGSVFIDGTELTHTSETATTKFRRQRVGFVFQHFNLLPTLTVLQNMALPLQLMGRQVDQEQCRVILDRVGLGDRVDHRPAELSGGQQQRVAIARALVTQPSIIFADEPTGALDSRAAVAVLDLLREAVDEFGRTLLMVSHDPKAASYADVVLFMSDGRLVGQLADPTAKSVAEWIMELDDGINSALARRGA